MQAVPTVDDSRTPAPPWDIPGIPDQGKPPQGAGLWAMHLVVHFAWKKWPAMWLCTDLQLQPMVWLGGQGLRKTMIGKLVTKKFGKRKM